MDTAKLWFALLCVCDCWTLGLAINCDWTTEYENDNRCCKACTSGEYPKVKCSQASRETVCAKCSDSTNLTVDERCFCKDKHLCSGYQCGVCKPRQQCKPGEQLIRHGGFDYTFTCEPCPNHTYNDAVDSTCKPITKCVGVGELFPGNKTHNARCVSSDPGPNPAREAQNTNLPTHSFMVACLVITVLTCLVFITFTAFQMYKYRMLKKRNYSKPCTHMMMVSSDPCNYKLSKEEKGCIDQEYNTEIYGEIMT